MDIDEFLDRESSEFGSGGQPADNKYTKENAPESKPQDTAQSAPLSSFDEVTEQLENKNLEKAEQSYLGMWNSLVQQKLKWNKELHDQLLSLSRQFSGILAKSHSETMKKSQNISEMLGKARIALKEGKKDLSFKIYSEVTRTDASIPNIFFEEKKMIWDRTTEFYKDLKTVTDNELIKRVSSLVTEINMTIERLNAAINSNSIREAASQYSKCIELYNQIPEGFLMQKNSIGIRILEAYKTLSIQSEISSLQMQLEQASKPQYREPASQAQNTISNAIQPTAANDILIPHEAAMESWESITAPKKEQPKKPNTRHDMEKTLQKLRSYSK